MRYARTLVLHGSLLLVASALALRVASSEVTAPELGENDVAIWAGSPKDLELVRWESKARTVVVTPRSDAVGRYFEVIVDKDALPSAQTHAGQSGAEIESPKPGRERLAFVTVSEGEKLARSLVPLVALRSVGRVDDAKSADFGLSEPAGTLTVRIAGKPRAFTVGAPTPGGRERYVRLTESGEVFAIKGHIVASLEGAERALAERSLHDFGDIPPNRLKLTRGNVTREVVSLPGTSVGWAKPGSSTADEAVGSWLGKLDRAPLGKYVGGERVMGGAEAVVRVDYFRGEKPVGYVEVLRRGPMGTPPLPGGDDEVSPAKSATTYYVRSERTRWPVEMRASDGAELEQALGVTLE